MKPRQGRGFAVNGSGKFRFRQVQSQSVMSRAIQTEWTSLFKRSGQGLKLCCPTESTPRNRREERQIFQHEIYNRINKPYLKTKQFLNGTLQPPVTSRTHHGAAHNNSKKCELQCTECSGCKHSTAVPVRLG